MFKVGELAVYPAQGVGLIEAIEDREIMGAWQKFYVMKIRQRHEDHDSHRHSPGHRVAGSISSKEIPKIYEILRTRDVTIDKQAWNKRYREYLEKIKTGSVYEIAKVLRDLFILKHGKDLSFGERR